MTSPLQWILSVWLFIYFLNGSASEDQKPNTAQPGDNVTLTCKVPINNTIFAVEWIRPDLKDNVIFWRDGKCDPENQHLYFQGRVELTDPLMKDGDASLTLKNVTIKDTGTYECYLRTKEYGLELITTVNMTVTDSGGGAGHTEDEGDKDGGDKDGGDKYRGDKDGGEEDRENSDGGKMIGCVFGIVVFGIVVLGIVVFGICVAIIWVKRSWLMTRLKSLLHCCQNDTTQIHEQQPPIQYEATRQRENEAPTEINIGSALLIK